MSRQPAAIDGDKLRVADCEPGHKFVFYMLDDAIDLLPPAKLHQIARNSLDLKSLRPDSEIKAKANLLAAGKAFDILVGLLDYIDECNDDVIFFADEAGSWQVGVDWERVMPPWFRVLSATAASGEYAERITALIEHHYNYGRDNILAIARKAATPEQRRALADMPDQRASRRRGGARS